MKRLIPTFLLGGLSVLLQSGCIAPPRAEFAPPEGFLVSNYKVPLLVDYDLAKLNSNTGKASCSAFQEILLTGLSFAWGDCSVDEANQNGRLNRVGIADYEYFSILRIYGKTTVHVYQATAASTQK